MNLLINIFILLLAQVSVAMGQKTHVLYWSTKNTTDDQPMFINIADDPQVWVPKLKAGDSVTFNILRGTAGKHSFGAMGTSMYTRGIYWANTINKHIELIKGLLDGETSITTINLLTSKEVNGLAVDSMNDNVYWTDALYNWIMVMHIGDLRSVYKILIGTQLVVPHGIAVHPRKSYLFWADSGTGKIERSSLGGQDRTLVYSGLSRPTAVCVDTAQDQLYWLDPGANKLYRSDLSGGSALVYYSNPIVTGLVGLTMHENLLMSASKVNKKIPIWDTSEPANADPIVNINIHVPFPIYDVKMLSSQQQTNISSPCADPLTNCHICVTTNDNSKHECLCRNSFSRQTSFSGCVQRHYIIQPPAYIYVSAKRICTMPVWSADETEEIAENCIGPITEDSDLIGILHTKDDKTYLYRTTSSGIESALIASNSGRFQSIISGMKSITGFAVDWLHKNLYWLDGDAGKLYAGRYDGSFSVVLHAGMAEPRAIAIHPPKRKLFWAESLPSGWTIRSSDLARDSMTTLVTGLGRIGHITIDMVGNKLFWTDVTNNKIEWSNLDGSQRKVFYTQGNPYGVAVFQDYVAWTDDGSSGSSGLHWAIKGSGAKVNYFQDTKVSLGLGKPGAILAADVFHEQHTGTDGCTDNNGGCGQLCLAGNSAQRTTCTCSLGYRLDVDGRTCKPGTPINDNFLLAATSSSAHIYQLDTTSSNEASSYDILPGLDGVPIAIDYDHKYKRVFWTDVGLKQIRRAPIGGGPVTTIKRLSPISVPDGMALDVDAEHIYYTDTGLDVIVRLSFTGTDETTLIETGLEQPRAISLNPAGRTMFWTDWGDFPKIETAKMDGSDRRTVISADITCPNGLTLDLSASKMFWCDCVLEKVEMADLDGSNRVILLEEVSVHYFGLAVDSNFIYISDWSTRYIKRLHRSSGMLDKEWKSVGFSRINGLVLYSNKPPIVPNTTYTSTVRTPSSATKSTTTKIPVDVTTKLNGNNANPSVMIGSVSTTPITPRANPSPTREEGHHTEDGISGSTLYIIAGSAVGGLIIIAATIIAVTCLCRRAGNSPQAPVEEGKPIGEVPEDQYEEMAYIGASGINTPYLKLDEATSAPPLPARGNREDDPGYESALPYRLPPQYDHR